MLTADTNDLTQVIAWVGTVVSTLLLGVNVIKSVVWGE